jgi:predicted nucleic acid-binding protein
VTIVLDASTAVAGLVDRSPVGRWAESLLVADHLAAPAHFPAETANALRRLEGREISPDTAAMAHDDLVSLTVAHYSYEPFASRVWELRSNLTIYDAWYVALAEWLDAPLATLDDRLARASGPRCRFLTPPTTPG